MSAYLIYIGKGKGTIPEVPARDLTFEEALLHGPGALLRSGLYVRAVPEPREETPPEIRIVEETEQNETTEEKPRRPRRRKENKPWQTE